ncbi:PAS domain-containing protein [Spongiimicrobium sp. 3-5]|uniref:PAS domain-containing protein n=1 Tax=Spongiimicrobium sp. 3-5 TaxID=3332596 RepID=UPI00397FF81E
METLSINFLIKDSPTAVCILDTTLCFIGHSKIWSQQFGLTDQNILGKSFYDIILYTPKELKTIHKKCLKGNTNMEEDQKLVHPNGGLQWLRWKINSWKKDSGEVGGLIIIAEDITESKRKEELLLKAKRVARIGGWEMDLITNKLYWTEITKEIHEVSPDYIPNLEEGINFYKEGEHREKIAALVSEAISSGKPWDTELQIVTATGKCLWVEAKGEAEIVNNKCVRLFGTFRDIDEKKKAALKYQEVSDRFAIASQATNIGVWEYIIPENTLIWDDNMYSLYGIKKGDFIGEVEAWETSVHHEDKERCQKEVELAIAGKKEFNTEFRVVWPSEEIRYIKAESTVRRDADGNPIRMIGVNWDITEIKRAEEKQRKLMKVTNEQNNNLLNFAHIVSHNLRSHASNLSMLTGFLSQEMAPEEEKDLTKMLLAASESLNETVANLNEVVQVKIGALEKVKNVNLYKTLKQVQKNVSVLLKDKDAKLITDVKKEMNISAVPAYLDSILLNLFTNSLKYSSPDRRLIIKISTEEKDDKIIVNFSDNGLGIDLKRHGQKLFGMYKTFHKHKDAKGIGLFITKNQMEAMNGKIVAESTVNAGSTFKLYFDRPETKTRS